jgi:GTPase SAR1 family protein
MPYPPSIDIRTTISYSDVMSSYNLGPNGAIMTSLNLFATKFDQVVAILEARCVADPDLEYIIIDTPGQIESFTWSASGQIITESLSTSFPTVLTFVADTPRCADPATFMSTMLYACSVMYRSNIPLCVAFNKTDIMPPDAIMSWMTDFDSFSEAMDAKEGSTDGSYGSSDTAGYYQSLTRSMALTLDEFYSGLNSAPVSAATGDGIEAFFDKIDVCRQEYFDDFAVDLESKRMAAKRVKEEEEKERHDQMMNDLSKDVEKINSA